MAKKLIAGSVSPVGLRHTVTTDDPTLDLTQVTSVTLRVVKPDAAATQASWAASIFSKTQKAIVLTYLFASGDIPVAGYYAVSPLLTLVGGAQVPCSAAALPVRDPFDTSP